MADDGEAPPVDPLVAIEEKYQPLLTEKLIAREVFAKQLEAISDEFSSEFAVLDEDYQKAKKAGELEEQLVFSAKIEQLQRLKKIQCDFRTQQLADADVVIERIALEKARELKAAKAAIAAAAEEE
ncbi:hypothetical protein AB1Y20_009949 [Prymnesium parvum]|uniref:Uncharacterized protein n=1 Tax=Prymnesium parvum TaxID=97485 RepID=A0AB34K6I9_PRYPA